MVRIMGLSYFNSNEVESIAVDIKTYANDYISEINNLFKRLSEVPYVTKEWVGGKSEYYFNKISLDKDQYINFGNKLLELSEVLTEDINEVQTCAKENKSDEEKGI